MLVARLLAALVAFAAISPALSAQPFVFEAEGGTVSDPNGTGNGAEVRTSEGNISGDAFGGSFVALQSGRLTIDISSVPVGEYALEVRYASPFAGNGDGDRFDYVEVDGVRYGQGAECSNDDGPAARLPQVSEWTDLEVATTDGGTVTVDGSTGELVITACYGFTFFDTVTLAAPDDNQDGVFVLEVEDGTISDDGDNSAQVLTEDSNVDGDASGDAFVSLRSGSVSLDISDVPVGEYALEVRYASPFAGNGDGDRFDYVEVDGVRYGQGAECSNDDGPAVRLPQTAEWTDLEVATTDGGTVTVDGSTGTLMISACYGFTFFDTVTLTALPPPPAQVLVSFAIARRDLVEDDGPYALEVVMSDTIEDEETVTITLESGDPADLGGFTSTTLALEANASGSFFVEVPITDDSELEDDETFVFGLSVVGNESNLIVGDRSTTSLVVIDDGDTDNGDGEDEVFVLEAESGTVSDLDPNDGEDGAEVRTSESETNVSGAASGDRFVALQKGSVSLDISSVPAGEYTLEVRYASPFAGNGDGDRFDYVEVDGVRYGQGAECSNDDGPAVRLPQTAEWTDLEVATTDGGTVTVDGSTGTLVISACYGSTFFDTVTLTALPPPPPPAQTSVSFAIVQRALTEGDGPYALEVVLSDNIEDAETVEITLESGDPADLGGFTGTTLALEANASGSFFVEVPITDDNLPEDDETFVFGLSVVGDESNLVVGDLSATALIVVDDGDTGEDGGDGEDGVFVLEAESGTVSDLDPADGEDGAEVRTEDANITGVATGSGFVALQKGALTLDLSNIPQGQYALEVRYASPFAGNGDGDRFDYVEVDGVRYGQGAECVDEGPAVRFPQTAEWTDLEVATTDGGTVTVDGSTGELVISACYGYTFFDSVTLTESDGGGGEQDSTFVLEVESGIVSDLDPNDGEAGAEVRTEDANITGMATGDGFVALQKGSVSLDISSVPVGEYALEVRYASPFAGNGDGDRFEYVEVDGVRYGQGAECVDEGPAVRFPQTAEWTDLEVATTDGGTVTVDGSTGTLVISACYGFTYFDSVTLTARDGGDDDGGDDDGGGSTAVADVEDLGVTLGTAIPNPFRSTARIPFSLDRAMAVRLSVYDVLGREVARLVDGSVSAGTHEANVDSRTLANGTYVVRLVTDDRAVTTTITVQR